MTIKKPSVQLALNGTPIYLNNIIMSLSVKREEKDMSGQKSSTKKSDKGIKAKELTVNGIIPYKCKEWLTDLFKLAEAEDEKGEQVKYRVSAIIAESVNMREVTFSDSITATEQQNNMAWQISFTLREVNSIAEKKEARKAKPQAKVQSEQAPVAKPQTEQTQESQPEQEDNSFWKTLDDAVGKVRN
ncbi:hypothetical protein EV694_1269 [Volucribacter psittacicida]|uniref:Phage protein n=1 Tax=Volucribacter psittacicida TaxID=203482 RepID=A0A4R1FYB5_9PAST|nr:hypothetical protein [Volucribacter psittacicida]TCJ98842.1 hypothetical protein EV694_1269 [Volucribacter psittacicida]